MFSGTRRRLVWKWLALVVGVVALGLAAYFYFHTPGVKAVRLTITAGNRLGTRDELADVLRAAVAPRHVTLELRETVGSEESLDWVEARKVDVALVQGGLSTEGRPDVREVAALQVEPLHLAVKKELADEVSAHLTALDGKTVNMGEAGTGIHTLAVQVLDFAGLKPRAGGSGKGYVPMPMSRQEMFAEEDPARLPDAVFIVSSLPSRAVKHLVTRHGYRLVPLRFGDAFALEALTDEERHAHGASEAIDKGRTFAATIPPFTYSVEPPVPAEPLPSLGSRLLLVAHKDVDPHAVEALIEAVFSSEFSHIIRPPLDPSLMNAPPEFPWHAGALEYQKRNKPLVSGEVMDSTHKAFAIGAAALSGLFAIWQWWSIRAESRRGSDFKVYLNRVTRIEERATQLEREPSRGLGALTELQEELTLLKTEALDRFTEGDLEGRDLMHAFLAHVADTRAYLTRLAAAGRGPTAPAHDGPAHPAGKLPDKLPDKKPRRSR
jgi:TRAP-type uncharacterized transport system substrate-binding protein